MSTRAAVGRPVPATNLGPQIWGRLDSGLVIMSFDANLLENFCHCSLVVEHRTCNAPASKCEGLRFDPDLWLLAFVLVAHDTQPPPSQVETEPSTEPSNRTRCRKGARRTHRTSREARAVATRSCTVLTYFHSLAGSEKRLQ